MKKSTVIRLLIVLVLATAIGVSLFLFPAKEKLAELFGWIEGLGPWGPAAVAVIYVPATILCVPGALLTLGAGSAFGVVEGTIAISIGSIVGASAAFLIGRTLLRGWVEQRVARNPKFQAIDRAIGEQGFKIVLLLRLSPVFPFNLLNYALSLTNVSFRDYFLASWIGMLPGTVMYVYVGKAAKDVFLLISELFAGKVQEDLGQKLLILVGLAATAGVTIYITRIAKRALDKAIQDAQTATVPQGATHE